MKKILIVTSQFPPYCKSLGGVIRLVSFSKKLLQNNCSVTVLSRKNNDFNYFGYKNIINEIDLSYVNKTYKPLKKVNKKKTKIHNRSYIARFKDFFSRFGIDYNTPYLIKYLYNIYLLNKKIRLDTIIVSAPPFSLFLLIFGVRFFFKNKIIFDFRDGWNTRFKINNNILFLISKFIEKNALKFTDEIITSTKVIKDDLAHYFNINLKRITLITNGYEQIISDINIKKKERLSKFIKVGYFGMINDNSESYRDINIIYSMLKNKILRSKFNFYFWGEADIKSKDIRKEKNFFFNGNLTHIQAIKKMFEMDYLLIIHTEEKTAKEVITGKFYDYLSTKKKIIVISKGETLVGKIVKKNNFGFNINTLNDNLTEIFISIADKEIQNNEIKDLYRYSRDFQNNKLINLI